MVCLSFALDRVRRSIERGSFWGLFDATFHSLRVSVALSQGVKGVLELGSPFFAVSTSAIVSNDTRTSCAKSFLSFSLSFLSARSADCLTLGA